MVPFKLGKKDQFWLNPFKAFEAGNTLTLCSVQLYNDSEKNDTISIFLKKNDLLMLRKFLAKLRNYFKGPVLILLTKNLKIKRTQ
jgi:hypothetical protein